MIDNRTKSMLEGLKTELGAVRTLRPTDDYNRGFNAGLEEAMRFVTGYMHGRGLFQEQSGLDKLRADMDKMRCSQCGLTSQHLEGCPRAN
jgi:hypothetical protein